MKRKVVETHGDTHSWQEHGCQGGVSGTPSPKAPIEPGGTHIHLAGKVEMDDIGLVAEGLDPHPPAQRSITIGGEGCKPQAHHLPLLINPLIATSKGPVDGAGCEGLSSWRVEVIGRQG
jgi:hypothetical protein